MQIIETRVKKWGNSLGVVIPVDFIEDHRMLRIYIFSYNENGCEAKPPVGLTSITVYCYLQKPWQRSDC